MSGRSFFASIVPVFGEPWRLPQDFPFYQWCVALFAMVTRIPVGASGRISGLFRDRYPVAGLPACRGIRSDGGAPPDFHARLALAVQPNRRALGPLI